jgi:3-deoxy-manno-octulosonate cytidylyltransferase (CMP-KDO synthetase)
MNYIALIPARYASTRFPGKPLAMLNGKPVVERVYERVSQVFENVYVATDDSRIKACVETFGGQVVMTSTEHRSGTDRCYEAYCRIGKNADVIINIQGDEPFIQPAQLQTIKACFDAPDTDIATLVKPFSAADDYASLANPNSPKVVVDKEMKALYFSRSIIPYFRQAEKEDWLKHHTYYKHIGLYAYQAHVLQAITSLPQSPLELAESLEQLRWLENGYTIKVGITNEETIGIDTPEDLRRAELFLKQQNV